jgi:hypothetical protein
MSKKEQRETEIIKLKYKNSILELETLEFNSSSEEERVGWYKFN